MLPPVDASSHSHSGLCIRGSGAIKTNKKLGSGAQLWRTRCWHGLVGVREIQARGFRGITRVDSSSWRDTVKSGSGPRMSSPPSRRDARTRRCYELVTRAARHGGVLGEAVLAGANYVI
jgi:hypothetical protein